MENSKELIELALNEISRLGDVAYSAHQVAVKYHHESEKYDKNEDCVKVERAMRSQYEWVRAVKAAL